MSAHKNKTTITAEPGKQELFITREFDAPRESVADRDGRLQAGMERGIVDSHERLDKLLETLQT